MTDSNGVRSALIRTGDTERVARYLPSNYRVVGSYASSLFGSSRDPMVTVIEGTDVAGWTLDDYVLPRLASGLLHGSEIITEVR